MRWEKKKTLKKQKKMSLHKSPPPLKKILKMHKSRYEMRNQEHIFDPGRLGEIPIAAVISTSPSWPRPQARRASPPPAAVCSPQICFNGIFSDDPGARCRPAS